MKPNLAKILEQKRDADTGEPLVFVVHGAHHQDLAHELVHDKDAQVMRLFGMRVLQVNDPSAPVFDPFIVTEASLLGVVQAAVAAMRLPIVQRSPVSPNGAQRSEETPRGAGVDTAQGGRA